MSGLIIYLEVSRFAVGYFCYLLNHCIGLNISQPLMISCITSSHLNNTAIRTIINNTNNMISERVNFLPVHVSMLPAFLFLFWHPLL